MYDVHIHNEHQLNEAKKLDYQEKYFLKLVSKFFLTDLTREQKAIEIKNIQEGKCALFGVIKIKVSEPKGIPIGFIQ